MKNIYIAIIAFFVLITGATAQSGIGFRAGLNYSNISSKLSEGTDKSVLGDRSFSSGFLIGMTGRYMFNDYIGISSELIYNQKGTKTTYDGSSYFLIREKDGNKKLLAGSRREVTDVTNAYFDLPVNVVGRFGPLEVHVGAYVSVLLSSKSRGEITFKKENSVTEIKLSQEYNYFKDKNFTASDLDKSTLDVLDAGTLYKIPKPMGAYYFFDKGSKSLYKGLDYGLHAALKLYFNRSLFIGVDATYGLADVMRDDQYISPKSLNSDKSPVYIKSFDRNISLQASLGFTF